MQLQVQLVHTEGDRLVVLVTGWIGDQCLGSALGEAGPSPPNKAVPKHAS